MNKCIVLLQISNNCANESAKFIFISIKVHFALQIKKKLLEIFDNNVTVPIGTNKETISIYYTNIQP